MTRIGRFTASAAAAAVIAGYAQPFAALGAAVLVKGDISRDDRVSVADIVLLKNYLLGRYGLNENQSIAADINCDGNIDTFDLAEMQDIILRSRNKLPKGTWIGEMQDIILRSRNKLPKGTWIGDTAGGKRYFSFGEGNGTVIDPTTGGVSDFAIECDEDMVVLKMKSGDTVTAFITWSDENSFTLKWEYGRTETFRYFCENSIKSSELLTGRWVSTNGGVYEINGLSGKLTDKNKNISRFEYAPNGEDIVFHFGSTDNNTEGKITRTDSMHFTIAWDVGTKETFTKQEIEVRNGITYVNGILIANKTYALPSDYNPGKILPDAQAASAISASANARALSLIPLQAA